MCVMPLLESRSGRSASGTVQPLRPQAAVADTIALHHAFPCLPACSFRDWLHHHALEAAMKARCGCAASAAQLRHLLRDQREVGALLFELLITASWLPCMQVELFSPANVT